MARRAVDNSVLARWRQIDSAVLLSLLSDHAKVDLTFHPLKDSGTSRWHASVAGVDYELLCTGPKFYDTRARRGGSGAIDLVMYLFDLKFQPAVKLLRERMPETCGT
jgi:hypothetical protein